MKHWTKFLFVFSFLTLIFLPKNIEARSGCCSGHDGVNCSAGAQSNGNVICNDGWRGSSCSYSEMVMCGGSSSSSTTTVQTVQPTSTPRPILVPTRVPTKVATVIPTNTPAPTLISTLSPTEIPILTPTIEPTKTEEISPTIQPQVLGETDAKKPTEPPKTSDYIIIFSILGLFGFGIYKLIVKIKNNFKKYLKKND